MNKWENEKNRLKRKREKMEALFPTKSKWMLLMNHRGMI
jgi:hypothetical protein